MIISVTCNFCTPFGKNVVSLCCTVKCRGLSVEISCAKTQLNLRLLKTCESLRLVTPWNLWLFGTCDSLSFVTPWDLWLLETCYYLRLLETYDSAKRIWNVTSLCSGLFKNFNLNWTRTLKFLAQAFSHTSFSVKPKNISFQIYFVCMTHNLSFRYVDLMTKVWNRAYTIFIDPKTIKSIILLYFRYKSSLIQAVLM